MPFSIIMDTYENTILVFIICELGERLANSFEEIDIIIEQFEWYRFPIELQRIQPMIMIVAQEPSYLECLGNILSSRELLKNVR